MNRQIRAKTVLVINTSGENLGVMKTYKAQRLADEAGLDLILIQPKASPPVARIMDWGKYKYEQSRKNRERRKNRTNKDVKEVKFSVRIGEHDYQTKVNHVRAFLTSGHEVKLTLQMRGRERGHKELGEQVMQRVLEDCRDVSTVKSPINQTGRAFHAQLAPRKDS